MSRKQKGVVYPLPSLYIFFDPGNNTNYKRKGVLHFSGGEEQQYK